MAVMLFQILSFQMLWWMKKIAVSNSLGDNMIHLSRGTAFPARLYVRPAKSQISLRVRVRVFAGHSVGSKQSKASSSGQQRQ